MKRGLGTAVGAMLVAMLVAMLGTMLTTSACQNTPEPYAPPVQRTPLADFRPYRTVTIVNMSDAAATGHFVQDITSIAAPTWRWTGQRPTVRVRVRSTENLRYTIDFGIADTTLKVTGPVTVSFLVNDQVLDRVRYDRAGNQHFEKLVPEGWVTPGQNVTVGAEVDKVWIPSENGPKLGMILVQIGLTQ